MILKTFTLFALLFSISISAHEGDEEVSVKNAPHFGGKVAAVVVEEDHSKIKSQHKHEDAHHDEPKYMAEILVSDDNIIRLYIYDLAMKKLDMSDFPGKIIAKAKTKIDQKGISIELSKSKNNFMGNMPVIQKKPFDIEVEFIYKSIPLHMNFKAMD